jgi:hypothetical protein
MNRNKTYTLITAELIHQKQKSPYTEVYMKRNKKTSFLGKAEKTLSAFIYFWGCAGQRI